MESQNIEFRAVIKFHEYLGMSKVSARKHANPEHARSSAKGGVKSRTSGSVQCQSRRLSHSSCNRR